MSHLFETHFKTWDEKARDHCRCTEKYRAGAHQKWNLGYTIPHYVPIIFHNLSDYDAHLFIRELGNKFDSGSIGVIAEDKEKYVSFNVNIAIDEYEMPSGETKRVMRQS